MGHGPFRSMLMSARYCAPPALGSLSERSVLGVSSADVNLQVIHRYEEETMTEAELAETPKYD